MTPSESKLGSTSAGFALAAAVTIVLNTLLAIAKDLSPPLTKSMAALTGHHWTTQGIVDILVFIGLGLIFSKSGFAEKIAPWRLIFVLVMAVIVAGGDYPSGTFYFDVPGGKNLSRTVTPEHRKTENFQQSPKISSIH